jgi:rhodanese-related sulfurtransferase
MGPTISMLELANIFTQSKLNELILDVRTSEEYRKGHVPGSKNIPHQEVGNHLEALKKFDRIYIHCGAGGRAKTAFEQLQQKGLKNLVCVVDSGMNDWIKAGLKIEKF